jgi:DNA-binding GntR family transcriptional regulator
VTLGHHDGQWTIQASRGARVLVKPTAVRAADALKMVHLLESPAVAEAVDEIVAAARAEAEDQAARLRRELAEVEAALADLSNEEE